MTRVVVALILVVFALGLSARQKLGVEREIGIAIVRALVQMFIVAIVIGFVFDQVVWSGVFLLLMLAVATWTSAGRMKGLPNRYAVAGTGIALAAGTALLVLFGGGAFPLERRYLIPIGGILIGNLMNTVSLAATRMRETRRSPRNC
jgi:putative ABC transport system permease protein